MNSCNLVLQTRKSALLSESGFPNPDKKKVTFSFKPIILIIIAFVIFSACDNQRTRYKIPESASLNEEYYQNALTVVDEALNENPDNADAYFKKSRILLEMQQPDDAIANINQAIRLAGNNAEYSLVKIRAHAAAGEMPQAFEEAQQAIKIGNVSEELYSIVAEGNLQNSNYRQALRYANAALQLNPNNGNNYYRKGLAYYAMSDTVAAVIQFMNSIKHGKQPEEVYATLVKMYVDYDNYEQAYHYLQKMDLDADVQMQFQKARILRRVGQTDSASTLLYTLLHDPEKLEIIGEIPMYRELKDIYMEARIYDSTLYYTEKLLEINENDKEAMITVARVYDRRYAYSQAINEYTKILDMDSTLQPDIHKLAVEELDDLRRKIAYLQRKREEEKLKEQLRPISPLTPVELQRNND